MESVFGRYRNLVILLTAVFVQVIALGLQVRRTADAEPTRLLRVWVISAVTPLEKGIVHIQSGTAYLWHNYFYLRGVRQENRDLKAEIQRLRLEQVRLNEDAGQARRLQTLLGFKEQFISKTVPAQVIGSSGSEQSRVIYIDKGYDDGIKTDMAVITSDGIVGKVLRVPEGHAAQVLLINDQTSGVGAILASSRLQGVLRGTPSGEVTLEKVMADEKVQPGEDVLTSGGDRIFPKGLKVGVVSQASTGAELFLNIRVKPSANLSKLEEVLVVTEVQQREPTAEQSKQVRAIDILTDRLPSVPPPAPEAKSPASEAPAASAPAVKPQSATVVPASGAGSATTQKSAASQNSRALGISPQPRTIPASTAMYPTTTPRVKPAIDQTARSAADKPKPKPAKPEAPSQPAPGDEPH